MKTIWKFPMELDGMVRINMPKGAEILTIQIQFGIPIIWALVDPKLEKGKRVFTIHGTGDPITDSENKNYIGTYQERALVWHVFELMGVS